jgi:hypothetical protein
MKNQKYICVVSGKIIPPERVEALEMLGIPENRWTCVEHSLEKVRQGIFMGEAGTSELLFVDKVYDNSVRSVFKVSEEEPSTDEEKSHFYSEKEIRYYSQEDDAVKKEAPQV